MKTENLIELQEEIAEAKTDKAKAEGQQTQLMKQLKDAGCKSIKEAEKRIEALKSEINTLNAKIKEKMDALEIKYDL